MPPFHTLGTVPAKRHTVFRRPDGQLYSEELVSTEGFSEAYSLVYHHAPPTRVSAIGQPVSVEPKIALAKNMQHRSLLGFNVPAHDDYLASRTPLLVNADCAILVAAPRHSTPYFVKNADGDELIFVHEGSGTLRTGYGDIRFGYGDYLHLPKGVIYQLEFDTPDNRLLIVESYSSIRFPKRYLSKSGQLLEHSPFTERDLRRPTGLITHTDEGNFDVRIQKQHLIYPYTYAHHPFDFVGWDGCFYPYALSIHDFEPLTGRVHLPPPIHQTFEAHNFVVCSFVPRLYDYHPQAIPAPYHHSNVDSDEVLYYVDGDFMSRKSVTRGQLTLHPIGIPHGPHPGTVEKSIGAKETKELAVMVDTFRPLMLTEQAMSIEQPDYYRSWLAT
jgi:homogentisate 1,2-dioxygenase